MIINLNRRDFMDKMLLCPVCKREFKPSTNKRYAVNGTLVCSKECFDAVTMAMTIASKKNQGTKQEEKVVQPTKSTARKKKSTKTTE